MPGPWWRSTTMVAAVDDWHRSGGGRAETLNYSSHLGRSTSCRSRLRSTSSRRRTHDLAREHPLRAVVGRVVDGGESREWRAGMVNKWTRDDLPSISDLCQADDERGNGERTVTLAIALDAVVDRLNKDYQWSTWVERERDMWRNSYGIAAVRLEQARERAEAAERERDEWRERA